MPPQEQNHAPDEELVWDPSENAVLAQLLDHVAEELAREYVRLMELAAEEEAASHPER